MSETTLIPSVQKSKTVDCINRTLSIDVLDKTNYAKVVEMLNAIAEDLSDAGLENNKNIELFSPVLADNVVFKIRVSNASERAINADISVFFFENNQLKEQFVKQLKVRSNDLAKLFAKAWSECKTCIPYDKWSRTIQGFTKNEVMLNTETQNAKNLLDKYFELNKPVAY